MLEDLTRHLESKPSNKSHLLYELAQCISAAIDADHVNVYIHRTEGNITKFAPEDPKEEYVKKQYNIYVGVTLLSLNGIEKNMETPQGAHTIPLKTLFSDI